MHCAAVLEAVSTVKLLLLCCYDDALEISSALYTHTVYVNTDAIPQACLCTIDAGTCLCFCVMLLLYVYHYRILLLMLLSLC
jgi:hypothetical protein